ncbi:FUSC family protein [Pseudonocardia kujensis]|uniref:FUSC family protein n=1 Tax=Pseudonocardia kujensis TaxID=1128675 RepID=UPI001E4F78B8|nr:FUSC family protein [Pseudonocardia kujensis]MCE0764891.1 FUSC family protein [Pseudonocardia kujensis]
MSRVAALFGLETSKFNVVRGVAVATGLLVPLIVLSLVHQERFWLSVSFGALFVGLSDPGGTYGYRLPRVALVAAAGALLTALGFGIGDSAWGWIVLAVLIVTVLGGLAVKYGLHTFVAAVLLNVWFVIAVSLPAAYRLDHVQTGAWAQALAWLSGAALWVACTVVVWLASGRATQRQPAEDLIPGSTEPVRLTRQVIGFTVLRAVAVSIAVMIAFGLHLPNADWMPVATLVAFKPSLQQSTLAAAQRVAGTVVGAVVAAVFLLAVDSKIALGVVIVVLGALAGTIRAASYTWYTAAVAGVVLIAMDLPHPADLSDEGRRILFTFLGVAIAVMFMLFADLIGKRRAATPAPA